MLNKAHGIFLVAAGPVLSQSKGLPCPIGAFYRSKAQQAACLRASTHRQAPLQVGRPTVAGGGPYRVGGRRWRPWRPSGRGGPQPTSARAARRTVKGGGGAAYG